MPDIKASVGERRTVSIEPQTAPKVWQGRFYEDFEPGDTFRSRFGRTVSEYDNLLFNSTFTLALITGLTVPDTSENAAANLQWTDIKLTSPVFVGDTLWAESEIVEKRESKSNPDVGIVTMRCRGINQREQVVIEYRRTFMVYKRTAPQAERSFPGTDEEWTV